MSTPSDQVFGQQQPTSAATEYQALQFMLLQRLLRIQTAIMVQIVATYGGGVGPVGLCDVLPLVDQIDGAGNVVPHLTIYGRPYLRQQGGKSAVILDPAAGDEGLMVFCSRDISSLIANAQAGAAPQQVPPASRRIFSFADGLYVGGYLNGEPTQYIEFVPNGGGINVVSPGPVTINGATISAAGEVTDAAGVVLGTHEHEAGTYTAGGNAVTGESGEPVT